MENQGKLARFNKEGQPRENHLFVIGEGDILTYDLCHNLFRSAMSRSPEGDAKHRQILFHN